MFYNYLIFSMVALSLRIFKKHFVSSLGNKSFVTEKQKFLPHETLGYSWRARLFIKAGRYESLIGISSSPIRIRLRSI